MIWAILAWAGPQGLTVQVQKNAKSVNHGTDTGPADRHITGSQCRQWTMFAPSYSLRFILPRPLSRPFFDILLP